MTRLIAAPRVSVVMPVHNAAPWLAATLQTVQAQSLQDWELIAVDDGSSDGSGAILAEAACDDRRIRFLSQANAGVSVSRNRGVVASRAPLVAFLDADDLWHPAKLLEHVALHDGDPGIGVSFARVEFLTPDGRLTGRVAAHPRPPFQPAVFLYENPTTTTSNWVLRREVFDAAGGFVPGMNHAEDLEWLLRVACLGKWRLEAMDRVLTYYRTSHDGLSASLERMERGWWRLVEEARRYAPNLVARHLSRAEAVHLRYLARRSLRLGTPATTGCDFMVRALRANPWLLVHQPRRTALTTMAVFSRPLFDRLPWALRADPEPRAIPFATESPIMPGPPSSLQPLVTVVMPLFNSAQTVAASLESVLAQTSSQLEIIVVDDGSTDGGVAICRRYEDSRIRIVQQPNRGLAGARNTGIRESRGAILAFLDSDDLWMPRKIELHLQHLQSHPEVGVSYSRSLFIDADGEPLGLYQTPPLKAITPELILCRNPISNGSCVVLRREVLEGIRFVANLYGETESYWFDDSFRQSEDIECWLRIALQTRWRIEGIAEPLTLYRVNSGGLSANVQKQFDSWQRFLEKTATYAPELIRLHGRRARGYQLRYLARRAIRERQARLGWQLVHRALGCYPPLLVEEPNRTVITLAAAYFGVLLPAGLYRVAESAMIRITGVMQKFTMEIQGGRPSPRSVSGARVGDG